MDVSRETVTDIKRRLSSKRSADVYNACIEVRKKLIKEPKGISRLVRDQVIPLLVGILKRTVLDKSSAGYIEDSYNSKVKDIICSILGNLCMDSAARDEVLKHGGVKMLGDILCTTEIESIQNRCCRCIANLCLNPSAWKPVHETEVIEKIVKLLKESENTECQQTYIRALRLLGQTDPLVKNLLDENAISAVMKYIDSDQESIARSSVVCIAHLVSRRNTIQFASQVLSSGKLPHLVSIAESAETSHDALLILADLSEQHNFRPAFGNAGGISLFKKLAENEKYVGKEKVISVLCLCCKEAVNRVKLREEGVLKMFIEFLKNDSYKILHLRIISALVCFLYDEASFDTLLEHGLVPVLVSHLRTYLTEDVFIKPTVLKAGPCHFDTHSSDIGEFRSNKEGKEMVDKHKFEPDIVKDENRPKTENKVVNETEVSDSSGNERLVADIDANCKTYKPVESKLDEIQEFRNSKETCFETAGSLRKESDLVNVETDSDELTAEIENSIGSTDPLSLSVACPDDSNKPSTSKDGRIYSIDSPSYEVQADDFNDYSTGAKCKRSFSPPPYKDSSYEVYSPISNVSYYSPVKSSPEYSPKSDRSISPVSAENLYSYCGLGSPCDDRASSPDSGVCKNLPSNPPSPLFQTDVAGAKEEWSWSPGESQDSSSDDDVATVNKKTCEQKSDNSKVKKTLPDSIKVPKTENILVEKRVGDGTKEGFKVIPAVEEEMSKKICRKRKKPDNALENNILILLSRVSQMSNPTIHFVTIETVACLLDYINEMEAPLARAARLLSRIFRNPHCFQKLLMLKIPVVIYQTLLMCENIAEILRRIHLLKKEEKRLSLSSGFRSRSSSISSVSSDSDRFSLFEEEKMDGEGLPAKRQKGNGASESVKREIRGILHKQAEEVCDPGKCGLSFLEDLAGVFESPYGRGIVEKLIGQEQELRDSVCLSVLYLCRNQGTVDFFSKLNIFNSLFTILEERDLHKFKTIVQGFSLLAHLMNFKNRFQSSYKSKIAENFMDRTANYVSSHSVLESDLGVLNSEDHGKEAIVDSLENMKEGSTEKTHSYSCKECMCTYKIPCVLHSNHSCVSKDVTFIVKGKRVNGSRNTLIKSSEIFAAMLEGHYSESALSEIELSETSKFAFTYVMHYLHGCKLRECEVRDYFSGEISIKSSKRLLKVLKEVDKYLLYDLKFELQDLLYDRYIIPGTALDIFEYAVMYDSVRIKKAAVSCLLVDTPSQTKLLLEFQKFMDSKFVGIFINTLMELLLD